MPRQPRFSKDDIVAAGLRIVRTNGFEAVSARALGKELGTSSPSQKRTRMSFRCCFSERMWKEPENIQPHKK